MMLDKPAGVREGGAGNGSDTISCALRVFEPKYENFLYPVV